MSYAIIRTGGKQYPCESGKTLRIADAPRATPALPSSSTKCCSAPTARPCAPGVPHLSGAKVTAEIVKHGHGEKIVVFKFKRRKNYARKQGHRQKFTEVRIKDIVLG